MARGEFRVGPWRRTTTSSGYQIQARFAEHETQVLRALSRSVVGWLSARRAEEPRDELSRITGMRTGHTEPPTGVAMRRLLPDMHRQDTENGGESVEELNSAMRSLHEPEILDAKETAGKFFADSLPENAGEVILTLDEARIWVNALNDLRLTLGSLLDITPHTPEKLPPGSPHAAQLGVYHWLTVMQESLLIAMTR